MASSVGNNPNIDPANNDTLAGTLRSVFSQLMRNVDGMLPARVLRYDRDTNRVQVEVLIAMVTTSGQQVSRAQIANIPVINLGGGGFIINFPLKADDLGFIMANDRDISLFLQSFSEAPPNTNRVKNFADSVFIPSVLTDYTIDGADTSSMVIQNLDGTVKVSLGTNSVTVKAPTSVTIDTPLTTITGKLVVNGLTKTLGGFASYGIATGIYTAYFGAPIYALGGGSTNTAFIPGTPGAPVPPPTPP
jgi:hypothetical protein